MLLLSVSKEKSSGCPFFYICKSYHLTMSVKKHAEFKNLFLKTIRSFRIRLPKKFLDWVSLYNVFLELPENFCRMFQSINVKKNNWAKSHLKICLKVCYKCSRATSSSFASIYQVFLLNNLFYISQLRMAPRINLLNQKWNKNIVKIELTSNQGVSY